MCTTVTTYMNGYQSTLCILPHVFGHAFMYSSGHALVCRQGKKHVGETHAYARAAITAEALNQKLPANMITAEALNQGSQGFSRLPCRSHGIRCQAQACLPQGTWRANSSSHPRSYIALWRGLHANLWPHRHSHTITALDCCTSAI